MREPGADEEEEDVDNTPGLGKEGKRALTEREQATVDRLSGQQAQADANKAAEGKARRDAWRQKKEAEERQQKEEETAEQKMARVAQAAADKARMAAELQQIEDAKNRPRGPEAPKPKPTPPVQVESRSAGPTCDAMEPLVMAVQRRWSDLDVEPAPKVEQYGREVMHPRDEALDFVDEWVKQIPTVLRRLQNLKVEDVKVVRAIKRAASVSA